MEIEAKFALPNDETFRRLQAIDRLAGFELSEGRVKHVRDSYLDTEDRLILVSGHVCRRREQDGEVVITLKRLLALEGAVHRREELEIVLPAEQPPVEWPASPVRDKVLRLIGQAPLAPLFGLQQPASFVHCVRASAWWPN